MTVTPVFITNVGSKKEWKANENFHIYSKTTDSAGKTWDLVFLSGYLAFDFGTLDEEWLHDSLIFSFNDLRWYAEPLVQVVPVVSLATVSNIDSGTAETIGWGVQSTKVGLIPGPTGSKILQLTCDIVVRGVDSHLEYVTYYVTAMGRIHK